MLSGLCSVPMRHQAWQSAGASSSMPCTSALRGKAVPRESSRHSSFGLPYWRHRYVSWLLCSAFDAVLLGQSTHLNASLCIVQSGVPVCRHCLLESMNHWVVLLRSCKGSVMMSPALAQFGYGLDDYAWHQYQMAEKHLQCHILTGIIGMPILGTLCLKSFSIPGTS